MKTGFKLALITLPIAAIGAGILAYVVSTSPPPGRIDIAERAVAVRVITAEITEITPALVGFGVVAPARTFEAIAQIGGTVEYVNPGLQNGQILPEDAVLLRLSPTDFNLAIAQASANIRSAEARLDELAISEQNQRAALAIEHEVLAVKAADLARAEALFASGSLAQSSRDGARATHLAQRQKVQGIEGTLALFPTQRAVQTEQIAVYRTSLATAELNLKRSELILPFPARVASHSVEVGQFLKTGQTAAVLDGIDRAEIEVQLSMDRFRSLVRAGKPAGATLPMDPTRMSQSLSDMGLTAEVHLRLGNEVLIWPARVERISDGIDPKTGTIGIVVQVDAAYGQSGSGEGDRPPLTKGMFVEVVLGTQPVTGIVVPRSALNNGHLLFADADNRLRLMAASPDLVQGGIALFTSGIAEGSRIVLSAPSPMIDGLLLDTHPDTATLPMLLGGDKTP
ncbi:MAG: hypothetical protein KDK00_01785 [Rhodobacteraceae bacterium]|nr:hypothetical protein [Paracoccaceae bacterium]